MYFYSVFVRFLHVVSLNILQSSALSILQCSHQFFSLMDYFCKNTLRKLCYDLSCTCLLQHVYIFFLESIYTEVELLGHKVGMS